MAQHDREEKESTRTIEVGLVRNITESDVVEALRLGRRGRVYDLDTTYWSGMPVSPEQPAFQVLNYRTPRGENNQQDIAWLQSGNDAQLGFLSELVIGTAHTGTHLDALSHITCGPGSEWYGGFKADKYLGDFGPLRCDAASIPPIVTRGLLIDVAKYMGVTALPKSHVISADLLVEVLDTSGAEVRVNDAVLVRTGYMSVWPAAERVNYKGAGLDRSAGEFLAEQRVVLVGADTEALEVQPSVDPSNPLPVHAQLLTKAGIYILELANLEQLSADGVGEFCFVCLPLRIKGATGSMVRPVAIA